MNSISSTPSHKTVVQNSGDRVLTPFREPRQQDYEHALRRRLDSWPDHSGTGYLTSILSTFLEQRATVTTENVTGLLLALASRAYADTKGNRHAIEAMMEALEPETVRQLLVSLSEIAGKRVKASVRTLKEDPNATFTRRQVEAARVPAVMQRLLGTDGAIPWDAQHDGHLVTRETARALGIVRWAKAETAERRARVNNAMSTTLSFGSRASRLWADRRPILAIDELTVYTAKLVGDLWTADPSIGVIFCPSLRKPGEPERHITSNPFDAFEIPFLVDERGWLRALLAIDHFPVLLEPRLGGFTVTAATGSIDLRTLARKGRLRTPPAPIWMRTLAEIALLRRFDEVSSGSADRLPPAGTRRAWLERYRGLLKAPVTDAFCVKHANAFTPRILQAVVKQREQFLALRDNLTATLEKLANDDPVGPTPDEQEP